MQIANWRQFCSPNQTSPAQWPQHNLSECFFETVQVIVLTVFLIFFGCIQFCLYRRHSTPIPIYPIQIRSNCLYHVQLICLWLVIILCFMKNALLIYFDPNHIVYGYMIFGVISTACLFMFSLYLIKLERNLQLPSVPSHGHGAILLIFWTLAFITENLRLLNVQNKEWWSENRSLETKLKIFHFVIEYVTYLLVFVLGIKAPGLSRPPEFYSSLQASFYGESLNIYNEPENNNDNVSTFRNFYNKVKLLVSVFAPVQNRWMKLRIFICISLLISVRVINVFVPFFNKLIGIIYFKNDALLIPLIILIDVQTLNSLKNIFDFGGVFEYWMVFVYVLLRFCQGAGPGSMGFLNNLRSFLWVRVQQYTSREIQVKLFRHLHCLSFSWHISRKTGEVLRIMDRGTDSVNNLVTYLVFSIAPTIIDIFVAVIFLANAFNIWFGLIVFVTMLLYIVCTILITEWRTKFQRRMNLADNEQRAQSVDSLLNYETVKYFNAEEFEINSYNDKIVNYQSEEYKNSLILNVLNTLQNIIITLGFLTGSLLCIRLVSNKTLTLGDYVLFGTYISQLYVPLNWLGTFYRTIQRNFIDMENMIELLETTPDVKEFVNARPLIIKRGEIEFDKVTFGYVPSQMVLKNISFKVAAGNTVALVGPSGSGKSTILRLLFRFFDINVGTIRVDGQNIQTLKLDSLREAIGVVPQDTVLFNNTILFNIKYGRPTATEGDILEAAKSAEIHDTIVKFPSGYDTIVGERGLKLSGGEKQRIGIARAILKAPHIVLLDEATSALDTQTERNIQSALNQVCANRTTIIIAHRLSTIIHVDEILVLQDGEIVERGKHVDLISYDGVYANMWRQQQSEIRENPL